MVKVQKLQKENEEKDKQIDLMAEFINKRENIYGMSSTYPKGWIKTEDLVKFIKEKDDDNEEKINDIENEFLIKIRQISSCHTCSYNGVLNLLLETAMLFSTKEIVDLLEAKRFI